MTYEKLSSEEEDIGKAVVEAAYKVHSVLGPGLLEKICETCLVYELRKAGYEVERQVSLPIHYEGLTFEEGLRIDILVEKMVIAEIKAVNEVNAVWQAQVLSHLKLANLRLGYVINLSVPQIRNGIRRLII